MSFLTPLYGLAGLAIALPILFHLIRRRPKERKLMSSLMFLDPTPPRLTRQSSIDQWLLLLLRATAIALLAFAFTRPYWNTPAVMDADRVGSQRMLLIDTSASMRRDGLWRVAVQRAEQIIKQSAPTDAIAVYQFDSSLSPLVSMDSALQTPASQRQVQAIAAIQSVTPTWFHTDLGLALMTAADLLQIDRDSASESNTTASEIVVVTDFQSGADLERLAGYAWPASCKVRVERVEGSNKGNARASLMNSDESFGEPAAMGQAKNVRAGSDTVSPSEIEKIRVRVMNTSTSTVNSFRLSWFDQQLTPIESSSTVCQVPAGSALTVRMAAPPKGTYGLRLDGDSAEFDNRYYLASSDPIQSDLLCIESAAVPLEESIGYFLRQIPMSDATRTVRFQSREPASTDLWPTAEKTPLIVASHALSESDLIGLANYVEMGGSILWVWDAAVASVGTSQPYDYARAVKKLTGMKECNVSEASVRQYAMLESIDFKQPLFADLSDSKFNDFSKIRFWKHRRLESKEIQDWLVLAKFDNGSPALISKEQGSGRVWILTAGWQPAESQLALSTKFVPLLSGLYRISAPASRNSSSYNVGMSLEIRNDEKVLNPLGVELQGEAVAGKTTTRMIRLVEPGIFRQVSSSGTESLIAVNTMESESKTSIAGLERLEKMGVTLIDSKPVKKDETSRRQLRAVELESQQGWWRWVLIGVMGAIGLESLLCIRKVV